MGDRHVPGSVFYETVDRHGSPSFTLVHPAQLHGTGLGRDPASQEQDIMTIHQTVIGCDVSKARLDIFNNGTKQFCAIDNKGKAISDWLNRLDNQNVLVVFEATGGYDRLLIRSLEDQGISYSRVNPARARDFARASGVLAKTDRLDAQVLADMGVRMELQPDAVSSPERLEIAALSTRRDQLVEFRKQNKTRAKLLPDGLTRRSIEKHLSWLAKEIAHLDKVIAVKIAASKQVSEQIRLLTSIPGIGPVGATVLVAMLPELGTRTRRSIAALSGLAPINHDSGKHRGKRRIRGGRRRVREALYMAALSASHSYPRFKDFYQQRLKANPRAKVALIALARKILVIANAIIREKKPFTT